MAHSLDQTIGDLVQAQQQIARQSEQLQHLLVRTNAVQEDERKRIAFDIHDGVIQLVIAAGYELQAAARHVGNGNADDARRKLERARQLMDQTVADMRRIVFDLHPTSLDSRGLTPSLEKYAASWQESTGIACSFIVEGEPVELASDKRVGVYRIVQEALTNIRKHASATRVAIRVRFDAGRLRLDIEDDGAGFAVEGVPAVNGHLGLMSMSERARNLGGRLDISSQPGQGTAIALDVPY
jgi:signal transduction histidine kinase